MSSSITAAPSEVPGVLHDDLLRQFGQDQCTGGHDHTHLISSSAGGRCDGKMSIPTMLTLLCLGVVTVSLNLGVLTRILRVFQRGHGMKPAFYLIGNLAFSDMAIGTYVVVVFTLHLSEPDDMWMHRSCFFNIGLAMTACQSIVLTIVLIALDKYIFIRHALQYSNIVTVPRVFLALAAEWVFSITIGILPALGMYEHSGFCLPCIFASVISKNFAILVFVTVVAVPYSIIVVLYSSLLIVALRIYKARRSAANSTSSGSMVMRFSSWKLRKSSNPASRTTSLSSKASKKATKRKRVERVEVKPLTEPGGPNAHDVLLEQASHSAMEGSSSPQLICRATQGEIEGLVCNETYGQQKMQTCSSLQGGADVKCNRNKELDTNDLLDGTSLPSSGMDTVDKTRASLDPTSTHISETTSFVLAQEEKESEDCTVSDGNIETIIEPTNDICESTTCEIVNTNSEQKQGSPRVNHADAEALKNKGPQEQALNGASAEHKSTEKRAKTDVKEEVEDIADEEANAAVRNEDKGKSNAKTFRYLNNIITKSRSKVQFLKEFKAAKTVLFIVGAFTCTYVPFVVGSMAYILDNRSNKCLLHSLNNLLFCGVVVNSLLNPLIYAYGYREFRMKTAHLKGILAKDKRRKNLKL